MLQTCAEKMTPPVRPSVTVLPFENVLVVAAEIAEIHAVDKPCYATASGKYSGSYMRTGDGDQRLSEYKVDRLLEEHRQPRHDGTVVEDASMEDLDPDLLRGVLARERRDHPRNFASVTEDEACMLLRIAAHGEDGVLRPTLAGLMALGRDHSSSSRNQFLASILEKTPAENGGYVMKNRGTCYHAIERALASAGMSSPSPKNSIAFFSLTLRRAIATESPAAITGSATIAPTNGQMSAVIAVRKATFSIARMKGAVTTAEIIRETGLAKSTVAKHVKALVDEGILTPEYPGSSSRQSYRLA